MHGDPSDAPVLMAHLKHEDVMVRWEAAKALQKIHNPVVVDALIDRIDRKREESGDVRQESARALGQYAQRRVFNALVAALDDPDYGVVHGAQASLTTLTGQSLGSRSRAWVTWRDAHAGDLFEGRQPYTWQPYNKPWDWYNHLVPPFVKPDDKPARPPTGMEMSQGEPDGNTATP
jgi:HEAT repeat protein